MKRSAVVLIMVVVCSLYSLVARSSVDLEKVRIKEMPFAVQCWTFHAYTLFETLEKVEALGVSYIQAYPGQPLSPDMPDTGFGPGLTGDQLELVRQRLSRHGISIVGFGVVGLGTTEESMREVFDFARDMGIGTIVTEPSFDDFSLLDRLVREYDIRVAIHNHPIPSKYARTETVLSRILDCDERIGACADTGHWMRSGVHPVEALQALDGRIVDVHLKDLDTFGENDARDVPFGSGEADIRAILTELSRQDYSGYLVVEHENPADLENPAPPILTGMEYVDGITYYRGFERILGRDNRRYNKQGWNHYGPGYFTLDEDTGVLTSDGGMGMLWYAAKQYGDFVLCVDYQCHSPVTNSGIFLRVPGLTADNSYIYHSFEIQIGDNGTGIHATGAVYDAEAPVSAAYRPTGEWNHYRITFEGDVITVELNDVVVVDGWRCRPRGKIRDWADNGYIGLQNHDSNGRVSFRNIYVKGLE